MCVCLCLVLFVGRGREKREGGVGWDEGDNGATAQNICVAALLILTPLLRLFGRDAT